jgi:hypothetical protein
MENFDQVRADALFLKGEYLSAFEMYLNEARESRDPRAAFDVAYMCHRGIGVPQNFGLAREFYIAASMLEGGAPYDIPDFRKEEERVKYENDRATPFYGTDGSAPSIPCCSKNDYAPTEGQLALYHRGLAK